MKKIILASKSPRRKELLMSVGIDVEVDVVETSETLKNNLPIDKAIEEIAREKAMAVASRHGDDIIVSADTVVIIDEKVLGKPKDEEEAFDILSLLRGRTHQVITSVCILYQGRSEVFSSITEVEMMDYTDDTIHHYIATKEPLDKAGAYGIQGKGAILVKSIYGDYYTVMGLPIAEVYARLQLYL